MMVYYLITKKKGVEEPRKDE